ncbi:MAG TPA: hypothetical protein VFL64_18620 [Rhizobacter sp.]|nr:hypothetical protein [Rhizobacter sp.]
MQGLFIAMALLAGCGGSGGGDSPSASPTPSSGAGPDPAAPITPTGPVYYFADCQAGATAGCTAGNNSNAGTSADAPKRDLTGFNVNTLPAGTQLLFKRGGAWNHSTVRVDNRNATVANPLIFDAYGSGAAPLLRVASNYGFEFGEWQNTAADGGYMFRNLKLDGLGTGQWGFWLRGLLNGVVIESVELTGFAIAINAQGGDPISGITVRNSHIVRNRDMGVLGNYSDSVFEGNLFEANNFSGSGFNHGTYLSGHGAGARNIVLRNNRYIRNSVVNGTCTGGNMTFHGLLDNVLIEGNTIEQDAAAEGCWLMSITQGYTDPEGFTRFVVRNNKLVNGGNTGLAAQSAPGILVEGNVVINTQATPQTAIAVGHTDYPNGDLADGNAVVRNNTACYPTPHANSGVTRVIAPSSTVTGNVMLTGAAAASGVCAR